MGQPVRSGLRAARCSGLTSPDPVRFLTPARAPRPSPATKAPDKPQNRQRQARHAPQSLYQRERLHEISRWIEAKFPGFPCHLHAFRNPGIET
jgi:hypothetical protein